MAVEREGREEGGGGEGEGEGAREREGEEKVETCNEEDLAPPDDHAHAHLFENWISVYGGVSYFLPPFFLKLFFKEVFLRLSILQLEC